MNIHEMHSWFDVLQDKGDSPYFTIAEKTQFLNRAQTKFVNEMMFKHYFNSGARAEQDKVVYSTMESIQAGEDVLNPLVTTLSTANQHRKQYYPDNGVSGQSTPTVDAYGTFSMKQFDIYAQAMMKDVNDTDYSAATWRDVRVLTILSLRWTGNDNLNTTDWEPDWGYTPIRYVRPVDFEKIKKNSFRSPTPAEPIYTTSTGGVFQIWPQVNGHGHPIREKYWGVGNNSGPTNTSNTAPSMGTYYWFRLYPMVIRSPLPMLYDPTTFMKPDVNVGSQQQFRPNIATQYPFGYNNVNCELPEYTHDDIVALALDDAGIASRDQALVALNKAAQENIEKPKFTTESTMALNTTLQGKKR